MKLKIHGEPDYITQQASEMKIKSKKTHHGVEIGEAINQGGCLGESLLKGIAEIVSRVGGDNQNRGSDTGEKNGEDGAAGGFPDTAFATNKNPFKSLLIQ